MEHLLRYAVLTLLELPRADLRDIMRLFVEKEFKNFVVSRIKDPQVPGSNKHTLSRLGINWLSD